ncbi:MAG: YceI family protein [Anaerolineae bacterium]
MLWTTNSAHTSIHFVARHMMLAKTRGEFQNFSVDFNLNPDQPEKATVEARIQTASIFTKDEKRDAHLRSADFFNAELYPEMVFKSTRVERTGGDSAKLHGDLTIRDVTKPVVLDVTYLGTSKAPWGTTCGRLRGQDQARPRGVGADLERGAGDRRLAGGQGDQHRHRG